MPGIGFVGAICLSVLTTWAFDLENEHALILGIGLGLLGGIVDGAFS